MGRCRVFSTCESAGDGGNIFRCRGEICNLLVRGFGIDFTILTQGKGENALNTAELRQWVEKHNIQQKTLNGFWDCFDNYRADCSLEFSKVFGEYNKTDLIIQMKEVGLFIDRWDENANYASVSHCFDYVTTYVPIEYRGNNLGIYKALFTLEGEQFDDLFLIH